jgi:hypothetical protein
MLSGARGGRTTNSARAPDINPSTTTHFIPHAGMATGDHNITRDRKLSQKSS